MASNHHSKNKRKINAIWWLVTILVSGTLAIEFFVDVPHDHAWQSVVFYLDLALLLGYAIWLLWHALLAKNSLSKWLLQEKLEIFLFSIVLLTLGTPRLSAALIICRLAMGGFVKLLDTKVGHWLNRRLQFRPSQTLALSFIAVILVGTFLLTFPAATTDGLGAPFLDALFIMTSAACVSGLTIHDIGAYYTTFGQGIILFGIQVGGLGIMVLSVSFTAMVGGRMPTRIQAGIGEIVDSSTGDGLKKLMKAVAGITFVMEFFGALLLFFSHGSNFDTLSERAWWAIFHAISAFCNAGITLAENSLVAFVSDPWICGIFMVLITCGGIGFFVIADFMDKKLWSLKNPSTMWARLHLQTKVVLLATLILDVVGLLSFLFLEFDGALSGLDIPTKINAALFQTVSLRTSGFSTVPMGNIAVPTIIFCLVWMFIGASPGSTGGGIKTTTAAVAIMGVRAMLRGRNDVEIMGRRLPYVTVSRSLSMVLISGVIIIVFLMLLSGTQNLPFERILFEVFSAFGTVGFSMDLTKEFDAAGRFLLILLMYIGRIGPLTLALAIGERRGSQRYQYPVGHMAVG